VYGRLKTSDEYESNIEDRQASTRSPCSSVPGNDTFVTAAACAQTAPADGNAAQPVDRVRLFHSPDNAVAPSRCTVSLQVVVKPEKSRSSINIQYAAAVDAIRVLGRSSLQQGFEPVGGSPQKGNVVNSMRWGFAGPWYGQLMTHDKDRCRHAEVSALLWPERHGNGLAPN
jgi:hypothetical protein